MNTILLALGLYVLVRFTVRGLNRQNLGKPMRKRFLAPLGLFAGFIDATGGGGWGPVGTPAILASGRMEPRKVIGSIDTSEFLVSASASVAFLLALGSQGIELVWVLGLLAGGLVAAPIAAWLVRHVPPRLLGSAVGGIIVFTNTRSLFNAFEVADAVRWPVYAVIVVGWVGAVPGRGSSTGPTPPPSRSRPRSGWRPSAARSWCAGCPARTTPSPPAPQDPRD